MYAVGSTFLRRRRPFIIFAEVIYCVLHFLAVLFICARLFRFALPITTRIVLCVAANFTFQLNGVNVLLFLNFISFFDLFLLGE